MSALRARCAICQKVHPSADAATRCAAQRTPQPQFAEGALVYPRYLASPDGARVIAWRRVKGTHAVEYQLEATVTGRPNPTVRRWVPATSTFATAEARAAARTTERSAAKPKPKGPSTTAKASFREAFRQNRQALARWQKAGRTVRDAFCHSSQHGRPMRFFTDQPETVALTCPACGSAEVVPGFTCVPASRAGR